MSRGATARLFVAVDPPAPVREALAAWARRAQSAMRAARGGSGGALRLLDADALHLTVCFLGNRPVAEIELLAEVVAAGAERACELSVGAPLWLPPRRPRTLAVEIHDHGGQLAIVGEQLAAALASVGGWEPERRRFRPHVTVARTRGGAGAGRRARARRPAGGGASAAESPEQQLPATPQLRFAAGEVVLYRSWLAPEGASYEALASGALDAAAP